jgi:hypothetical protein
MLETWIRAKQLLPLRDNVQQTSRRRGEEILCHPSIRIVQQKIEEIMGGTLGNVLAVVVQGGNSSNIVQLLEVGEHGVGVLKEVVGGCYLMIVTQMPWRSLVTPTVHQ